MKIFVYIGKDEELYWVADTPERLAAARREMFNLLDDLGCYDEVAAHRLVAARRGDPKTIRWILDDHQDYEYEGWRFIDATIPTVQLAIEALDSHTLLQPIPVTVVEESGMFISSVIGTNVNASGITQADAIDMLKDIIEQTFEFYSKNEVTLGPEPHKDLIVLRKYIQ